MSSRKFRCRSSTTSAPGGRNMAFARPDVCVDTSISVWAIILTCLAIGTSSPSSTSSTSPNSASISRSRILFRIRRFADLCSSVIRRFGASPRSSTSRASPESRPTTSYISHMFWRNRRASRSPPSSINDVRGPPSITSLATSTRSKHTHSSSPSPSSLCPIWLHTEDVSAWKITGNGRALCRRQARSGPAPNAAPSAARTHSNTNTRFKCITSTVPGGLTSSPSNRRALVKGSRYSSQCPMAVGCTKYEKSISTVSPRTYLDDMVFRTKDVTFSTGIVYRLMLEDSASGDPVSGCAGSTTL
mmetsp:Transcript_11165/g.31186  ORF Transcript_11165/g.31186 Transcript_11165/m.31186 type:complete len:302 (+) Transcript_11165:1646-2551(+)